MDYLVKHPLRRNGKPLKPGERVDLDPKEASALLAAGIIERSRQTAGDAPESSNTSPSASKFATTRAPGKPKAT